MQSLAAPWAEVIELREAPSIAALLRRLVTEGTPLHLSHDGEALLSTRLLAHDAIRRRVSLEATGITPHMPALLAAPEVVATAYTLGAQVQFELQGLVLVHGAGGRTLQAAQPWHMLRINRRRSPRLQPGGAPVAWLHWLDMPGIGTVLKLLDVSEHGCALLLPGDLAPPQPGALFPRARLQLDDATCLDLGLELLHVTCMNDGAAGLRLGFRFVDVSDAAGGVLRRYLAQAGAVGQSGLSSPV